jgi:two-component system, LytTR family, response regulator
MILRALVIDDEAPARRRLTRLLEKHPHQVQIVGEASNGLEAVARVESHQPDLLFLDIQMPGLSGFEMLEKISTPAPRIIFTTAYDAYALQAFEQNTVDYLLKPIEPQRLAQAIDKLFLPVSPPANIASLLQQLVPPERKILKSLAVKLGDRVLFLPVEEIVCFQAIDKYVEAFTLAGKKYLVDKSLTELEHVLPEGFVRIQRSFILQFSMVVEAQRHFNSRYLFVMKDGQRILSGKSYYPIIQEIIG